MGAIAEAINRFAQPLLEQTDGSLEQLQKALSLSMLFWNLAVAPEAERDPMLARMQPVLELDDEAFANFKRDLAAPMIERHRMMFPAMHRDAAAAPADPGPFADLIPASRRPPKPYAGTGRNEHCPCGSGKKYKVCCGR